MFSTVTQLKIGVWILGGMLDETIFFFFHADETGMVALSHQRGPEIAYTQPKVAPKTTLSYIYEWIRLNVNDVKRNRLTLSSDTDRENTTRRVEMHFSQLQSAATI